MEFQYLRVGVALLCKRDGRFVEFVDAKSTCTWLIGSLDAHQITKFHGSNAGVLQPASIVAQGDKVVRQS